MVKRTPKTLLGDPETLGERGRAVYDAMFDPNASATRQVLLFEICRSADRMEKMDRILRGDTLNWAHLTRDESIEFEQGEADEIRLVVKIDSLVGEARQQQQGYRLLISQFESATLGSGATTPQKPKEPVNDQLAKQREQRRAARRPDTAN